MTNKSFSVSPVVKYGFSPFCSGFTAATVVLGSLFALSSLLGESIGLFILPFLQRFAHLKETVPAELLWGQALPVIAYAGAVFLITLLFAALLACVMMRLSLFIHDGRSFAWSSIFPTISTFTRYCAACALFIPIVMLGIAALVVPGIFLVVKLWLLPYYIVEGAGVIESFKKSWHATTGYFWTLLGVFSLLMAIRIVGMMLLNTLVVVTPLWLFVVAKLFVTAFIFGMPMMLAQAKMYRILSA